MAYIDIVCCLALVFGFSFAIASQTDRVPRGLLASFIFVSIVSIVANAIMMDGIVKNRRNLILAWLVIRMINIVYMFVTFLTFTVKWTMYVNVPIAVISFVICVVVTAVLVYFWCAVYGLFVAIRT